MFFENENSTRWEDLRRQFQQLSDLLFVWWLVARSYGPDVIPNCSEASVSSWKRKDFRNLKYFTPLRLPPF
jgi:hypothetical protein